MKLLKLALVAVAATSFVACNKKQHSSFETKQQSQIINGIPVASDMALGKSTVGLFVQYDINGDGNKVWFPGCTGSVLTEKFILTAAHCVERFEAQDMAVNFSLQGLSSKSQMDAATRVTDINSKFVVRKVKAILAHPAYAESGLHDLAIMMLETPAPTEAIPVQLLPDTYLNADGTTTLYEGQRVSVTLLGFGLIAEEPRQDTNILRTTTLPARFEGNYVITDQTGGTGGCNGDSGGPAFMTIEGATYQVGVTHGPHTGSSTCHEEGQWTNPALDKKFLADAQAELSKQ